MPDNRLDGSGVADLLTCLKGDVKSPFNVFADNAAAHNSIYRGKFLGTSVTAAQWQAIRDGKFTDMYIGDYWTIGGQDWVICHFNYYINKGSMYKYHIVIMPRAAMTIPSGTVLYGTSPQQTLTLLTGESSTAFNWSNNSGSTAGGYKYSRMRQVIMKAANKIVIDIFGPSHVEPISVLYPNPSSSTDSGVASGWTWFTGEQNTSTAKSICDLCSETQVCGQQAWGLGSSYGNVVYEIGTDNIQFSIFALNSEFANIGNTWWLRSVRDSSHVAYYFSTGFIGNDNPYSPAAVRPRFVLVG